MKEYNFFFFLVKLIDKKKTICELKIKINTYLFKVYRSIRWNSKIKLSVSQGFNP